MTAWTDHVRTMAKELGLTYMCASSDPRVKNSYNKAPRKSRTSKYLVPTDLDDEDTKANRAAAMARVKAMKAKRLANAPAPRVKKPMSEETKAMLKARREARKADVAAKFQKFWNKHEGVADAAESILSSIVGQAVMNEGIEGGVDTFLADMMDQAVALLPKKPRTKKNGQPYKKRESADNKDLRERREKKALKDEKKK